MLAIWPNGGADAFLEVASQPFAGGVISNTGTSCLRDEISRGTSFALMHQFALILHLLK